MPWQMTGDGKTKRRHVEEKIKQWYMLILQLPLQKFQTSHVPVGSVLFLARHI